MSWTAPINLFVQNVFISYLFNLVFNFIIVCFIVFFHALTLFPTRNIGLADRQGEKERTER